MAGVHAADMVPVYEPGNVFTIAGRVAGFSDDKGTIVVADSADDVLRSFESWGFTVTSIASLADVEANIGICEALASRDPRVGDEEYLNLLPDTGEGRRPHEQIFNFVGQAHQTRDKGTLQAGWAVAVDADFLKDYLRGVGFEPYAVISYADSLELRQQMHRVACEIEDDESSFVNLKTI